ncbi:MAG: DUF3696 domain-containing protein [Nitrospirae bacterium]|nr:DUF3696 domain-containing protein [Nitrospirota bacterium]
MFTEIYLEYFKCFERLKLPLAPLTLLTGLNSSGKSSILQALTLLHQTVIDDEWSYALILHGSVLSLGNGGEVIDKLKGRNELTIGLSTDQGQLLWTFSVDERERVIIPLVKIKCCNFTEFGNIYEEILDKGILFLFQYISDNKNKEMYDTFSYFKETIETIMYISAERLGPRETYLVSTPKRHLSVGTNGEFTPWYLYEDYYARVNSNMCIKDNPPNLGAQVNAWMNEFFPGSGFVVEQIEGTNLVTLRICSSKGGDYHRPQNVGYGLTHVLPILTACLGAEKGNTILIESPESHLHPGGQSKMGEFLGLTAASGVQVILETHSDHILNGVRRAVKQAKLSPDDVVIHYFNRRPDEDETDISQVISPAIDKNGNIHEWPKGFFDQFDKDMEYFAGWGK